MRLRFLGTDSERGTCPAVYETDRGTFAVQGKLIVDREALADCVSRGFRRGRCGDPEGTGAVLQHGVTVGVADRAGTG